MLMVVCRAWAAGALGKGVWEGGPEGGRDEVGGRASRQNRAWWHLLTPGQAAASATRECHRSPDAGTIQARGQSPEVSCVSGSPPSCASTGYAFCRAAVLR